MTSSTKGKSNKEGGANNLESSHKGSDNNGEQLSNVAPAAKGKSNKEGGATKLKSSTKTVEGKVTPLIIYTIFIIV